MPSRGQTMIKGVSYMRILLPAVALLALAACGEKAEKPVETTTTTTAPATNDNATGTVAAPAAAGTPTVTNWAGRYVGKMPSADGKGVDATLALKDDGSYDLSTVPAGSTTATKVSGKFTWGADGKTVILDAAGGNVQVAIIEGGASVLDAQGKPYTGADATKWQLRKR